MKKLIAATTAVGMTMISAVPAHAAAGPDVKQQWWFASWNIQDQVWPLTKGKGVTVAVIDSGVNAQLPDMKPVVLPGISYYPSGGDGRKDIDWSNKNGHGTGMASLIASQGTKTGFMGIAPQAKILPIAASVSGPGTSKAIRFAVDHGAKVISISQGLPTANLHKYDCPPQLIDAIGYAASKDAVIIAGAGNDGDAMNPVLYPASCPGVVAVGAFGRDGKPWVSTQRQKYVVVGAPGDDVGYIGKNGHAYTGGAGTSQATALTSGAAALMRSYNPRWTARQIVQRLIATAKDFGKPGWDNQLGHGVISIPRALKQDVPASAPNPVHERLDKAIADQRASAAAAGPKRPAAADEEADSEGTSPLLLAIGWGSIVLMLIFGFVVFLLVLKHHQRSAAAPPYGSFGHQKRFPQRPPGP